MKKKNLFDKLKTLNIKYKIIWTTISIIAAILFNVISNTWEASAYVTSFENRLGAAEKKLDDFSNFDSRLSKIEGKIDIVLKLLQESN
jgi:hypothetical protein